eukprot:14288535-Ditylum_brightwellii.AAC.1
MPTIYNGCHHMQRHKSPIIQSFQLVLSQWIGDSKKVALELDGRRHLGYLQFDQGSWKFTSSTSKLLIDLPNFTLTYNPYLNNNLSCLDDTAASSQPLPPPINRILVLGDMKDQSLEKGDIYAHVITYTQEQLLHSMAVSHKQVLKHADCHNTFFHRVLPEDKVVIVKPLLGRPMSKPDTYWNLDKHCMESDTTLYIDLAEYLPHSKQ